MVIILNSSSFADNNGTFFSDSLLNLLEILLKNNAQAVITDDSGFQSNQRNRLNDYLCAHT
jgi:hypothetical protein